VEPPDEEIAVPRPTMPTIAAVVALVATLAGCAVETTAGRPVPAGSAQEFQPERPAIEEPTTAPPSGPARNERGLIPTKLGETAGFGAPEEAPDQARATFSIDSVEVDPPCDEYGIRPDSGHTLLLAVRAATSSDQESAQTLSFVLNPLNFVEIGKDGVTRPAQLGSCIDISRYLPLEFGINQRYSGVIELVVPEASGILALQDTWIDGGGGWEWKY
jgi:hypothetical protein